MIACNTDLKRPILRTLFYYHGFRGLEWITQIDVTDSGAES